MIVLMHVHYGGSPLAVKSFVEMTQYLLSQGKDLFILSFARPTGNYFGQQRSKGGRNENPTLQQCVQNAAALHVQKSQALDPVSGNCSRKRCLQDRVPKN